MEEWTKVGVVLCAVLAWSCWLYRRRVGELAEKAEALRAGYQERLPAAERSLLSRVLTNLSLRDLPPPAQTHSDYLPGVPGPVQGSPSYFAAPPARSLHPKEAPAKPVYGRKTGFDGMHLLLDQAEGQSLEEWRRQRKDVEAERRSNRQAAYTAALSAAAHSRAPDHNASDHVQQDLPDYDDQSCDLEVGLRSQPPARPTDEPHPAPAQTSAEDPTIDSLDSEAEDREETQRKRLAAYEALQNSRRFWCRPGGLPCRITVEAGPTEKDFRKLLGLEPAPSKAPSLGSKPASPSPLKKALERARAKTAGRKPHKSAKPSNIKK